MTIQDFLTREMGNTNYAHRSYVSGLNGSSAVLELAVSVEELATPLKLHIYAEGTHKINSYSWNSGDAMATANYAKLITLAAGIALKWQAHVEQEKLDETQPIAPPFIIEESGYDSDEYSEWEDGQPDDTRNQEDEWEMLE